MVAFIDTPHLTMFSIVFLVIFSCQVNARLLDPVLIRKELQTFARDALGVEEMQVKAKTNHRSVFFDAEHFKCRVRRNA